LHRYRDLSVLSAEKLLKLPGEYGVGLVRGGFELQFLAVEEHRRRERFPADGRTAHGGFTELIGTAIANADSRVLLAASRAIVAAAPDGRAPP
jgi:hypothetical protein